LPSLHVILRALTKLLCFNFRLNLGTFIFLVNSLLSCLLRLQCRLLSAAVLFLNSFPSYALRLCFGVGRYAVMLAARKV
jgi:hypothetical protein